MSRIQRIQRLILDTAHCCITDRQHKASCIVLYASSFHFHRRLITPYLPTLCTQHCKMLLRCCAVQLSSHPTHCAHCSLRPSTAVARRSVVVTRRVSLVPRCSSLIACGSVLVALEGEIWLWSKGAGRRLRRAVLQSLKACHLYRPCLYRTYIS